MKIDGNNDGFEGSPLKICENCKWWDLESKSYLDNSRHCTNPKLRADSGDGDDCMFPNTPGTFTGPRFGCIHWEGK